MPAHGGRGVALRVRAPTSREEPRRHAAYRQRSDSGCGKPVRLPGRTETEEPGTDATPRYGRFCQQ